MMKEYSTYSQSKIHLNTLSSFLSSNTLVTFPDDTNYLRQYSHSLVEQEPDDEDEFYPIHDDVTPSDIIDINSMMYLRKESAVNTDMMHLFHYLYHLFIPLLLLHTSLHHKEIDDHLHLSLLNTTSHCKVPNQILNVGRSVDEGDCSWMDYFTVSDNVKRMDKKRYDMGKPWPVDVEWMGSLFREKSQVSVKAEEKIVFCAPILPYYYLTLWITPKCGVW